METHPFITKWQSVNKNYVKDNEWVIHKNIGNEVEYFGFIPEGAKYLIVGTFPAFKAVNGVKPIDCNYDFFYGSVDSPFWSFISEVFKPDQEIKTENDIFEFLRSKKIAITDILYQVERVDENRRSSRDEDLRPIKYNEITKLVNSYPSIGHIIFTSGTISSRLAKGKSAAGWSSLQLKELLPKGRLSFSYDKRQGYFVTTLKKLKNSRELTLAFLYSPSDGAWAATDGTIKKAKRNLVEKQLNYIDVMKDFHGGLNDKYDNGDLLKLLQWKVVFSQLGLISNSNINYEIVNLIWKAK